MSLSLRMEKQLGPYMLGSSSVWSCSEREDMMEREDEVGEGEE